MSLRSVYKSWWPLAVSWLLMACETPIVVFFLGRMSHAERNIAAFGGVALPVGFIIEAPILMLLSASTALSRDEASYKKLRFYTHVMGAALTLVHVILVFTPLYHVIAVRILAAPEEVVGPTRECLMFMTPWTWAIGYRRFNQGVLIRFGFSKWVGAGTLVRLCFLTAFLAAACSLSSLSGAAIGGLALTVAVVSEAIFVKWKVAPVRKTHIPAALPVQPLITTRYFFRFYTPLALTALLTMLTQPIGSASLSRMPDPMASLTVWPVLGILVFLFRCTGLAMTEVSVAMLDDPKESRSLFPFCRILMVVTSGLLLIIAATPLSSGWFRFTAALSDDLVNYGRIALLFSVPLPALSVLQSWYQGNLLVAHRTRPITEAIILFLTLSLVLLLIGVKYLPFPGLYYFNFVMLLGTIIQTLWLRRAKMRLAASAPGSFRGETSP